MTKKSSKTNSVTLIIKYLVGYWYYVLAVFAVWLVLILASYQCYLAFPSMLCLAYFVRARYDYLHPRQHHGVRLSKSLLVKLLAILAGFFLASELFLHGIWGVFSILPLAYIWLMNRYDILKLFVLPVSLGYFLIISQIDWVKILLALIIALGINLAVFALKRERKVA